MSTLELEAQKAELAREILGETDKNRINEWMAFFNKKRNAAVRSHQPDRKIGLLDGKASFTEDGDGKITAEEFLGI